MPVTQHLKPAGLFINPAYSQVVSATGARTIYISGQVALDEHGALVGGNDLGAQTTQVMKNLGLALAAANAEFTDLVKITTFIVGYRPEHRAIIAAARTPFFSKGPPPASTLLGVAALAAPDWLIEIEGIAVVAS